MILIILVFAINWISLVNCILYITLMNPCVDYVTFDNPYILKSL